MTFADCYSGSFWLLCVVVGKNIGITYGTVMQELYVSVSWKFFACVHGDVLPVG